MTALIEVPDFAALADAEYVDKRENRGEWEGPIPAPVSAAVAKLVANGKTLVVKVSTEDAFNNYRNAFIAAARVVGLSANVVRTYANKEKTTLTGARISLGAKRGRKATETAE